MRKTLNLGGKNEITNAVMDCCTLVLYHVHIADLGEINKRLQLKIDSRFVCLCKFEYKREKIMIKRLLRIQKVNVLCQ